MNDCETTVQVAIDDETLKAVVDAIIRNIEHQRFLAELREQKRLARRAKRERSAA